MRVMGLLVAVATLAGCSAAAWDRSGQVLPARAYWGRPGATLPVLADESQACYHAAIGDDAPAALPGPGPGRQLLPRTEPPPKLWERAPRKAGFEHVDEELRYDRCMKARGWQARRSPSSPR